MTARHDSDGGAGFGNVIGGLFHWSGLQVGSSQPHWAEAWKTGNISVLTPEKVSSTINNDCQQKIFINLISKKTMQSNGEVVRRLVTLVSPPIIFIPPLQRFVGLRSPSIYRYSGHDRHNNYPYIGSTIFASAIPCHRSRLPWQTNSSWVMVR